MAENWYVWWTSPTPCNYGTTPQSLLDNIIDRHEHIYGRLCPLTHMGEDKEGCPIYWEQSGPISQVFSELADNITLDEMVTRHIRNQELAMCRLHHLSKKYNRPIEKQVIVFNLESLSYSLDTRSLSVFRRIIACDQDFYPERLKHFFVINAPWYFTAIWAVVKPWIDPVTREKMQIIGTDFLPTLTKYIDIEMIPTELGGKHSNFRWSWPYPEESCCTPRHIEEYNIFRGRYDNKNSNNNNDNNSTSENTTSPNSTNEDEKSDNNDSNNNNNNNNNPKENSEPVEHDDSNYTSG